MLICPNCKKKYRSNILVCPKCRRELLPPSAIALQTEHPELAQTDRLKKSFASRKPPIDKQSDPYVEIYRGGGREAKEVVRLLEKEGILCRVERAEPFGFHYPVEGAGPIAAPEGTAVLVPSSQVEKARALLDWETQKDQEEEKRDRFLDENGEEMLVCPACEAEISPDDTECSECGLELDPDEHETDREEYYCSSCGEACDPDDPVCPNCGAHFDH